MSPPFPIVLCPTDLSEIGNRALPVAFRLAQNGGTVHLLCVLEDYRQGDQPADVQERARRQRAEENEARSRLGALIPADRAKDLRTHCHVIRGSDVSGIIETQARNHGASVIVMSTHGRTGIGRLLLGSVASDVVKRTDLPVILVRRGEPTAEETTSQSAQPAHA